MACSGAMYVGVPTVVPVAVSMCTCEAWPIALAMPKSATLTLPWRVSSRFSGLRSRCTMPRAWAWSSAASRPSSTPATCGSDMWRTCGRSEPRSRYSIEM